MFNYKTKFFSVTFVVATIVFLCLTSDDLSKVKNESKFVKKNRKLVVDIKTTTSINHDDGTDTGYDENVDVFMEKFRDSIQRTTTQQPIMNYEDKKLDTGSSQSAGYDKKLERDIKTHIFDKHSNTEALKEDSDIESADDELVELKRADNELNELKSANSDLEIADDELVELKRADNEPNELESANSDLESADDELVELKSVDNKLDKPKSLDDEIVSAGNENKLILEKKLILESDMKVPKNNNILDQLMNNNDGQTETMLKNQIQNKDNVIGNKTSKGIQSTVKYLEEINQNNLPKNERIEYSKSFPYALLNDNNILRAVNYQILHYKPLKFIKNSQNPCFVMKDPDGLDKLYCLPYFFIPGFPKGGTTDLYERIIRHQQVIKPTKKSPNFWAPRSVNDVKPLESYLKCFQATAAEVTAQTLGNNETITMVTGDFDQGNMYRGYWELDKLNFNNKTRLPEPLYLTPHRIHHLIPNAKIVITIRDPVIRMISDYNHVSDLRGYEVGTAEFHNNVSAGIDWFRKCTALGYSVKRCTLGEIFPNLEIPTKYPDMIRRGIYSEYIKPWLEVFPKENILFVKFEDYRDDPLLYLDTHIIPFLGLDNYSGASKVKLEEWQREQVVINKSQSNVKPMDKTVTMLQEFYRDFTKELVTIIGEKFNYNN